MTTRRELLLGGCALTALLATSGAAEAGEKRPRASRITCPHRYCRNHRPVSDAAGTCVLALRGRMVGPDEEHLP